MTVNTVDPVPLYDYLQISIAASLTMGGCFDHDTTFMRIITFLRVLLQE